MLDKSLDMTHNIVQHQASQFVDAVVMIHGVIVCILDQLNYIRNPFLEQSIF